MSKKLTSKSKILINVTSLFALSSILVFTTTTITSCNKRNNIEVGETVSLKNEEFEASIFGWENKTIDDIINQITIDWLISNKTLLFNNDKFINSDKITNLTLTKKNSYLSISFKFNNESNFSFKIINFIALNLKKSTFTASEFNLENQTTTEAIKIVKEDWIIDNKALLFDNDQLLTRDKISKFTITKWGTKIGVGFLFDNQITLSFEIIDFKESTI